MTPPVGARADSSASVWTVAEETGGRLDRVSYELLTWGRRLVERLRAIGRADAELCTVVLGADVPQENPTELILRGADAVYVVESPALRQFLVEPYAQALQQLIAEHRPWAVLAGATSMGRTLMPYLAVRVPTGLTADCTGLDVDEETGNLVQTRPAVGGNVLATIITARHRPQMATVRPRSAAPSPRSEGREGRIVKVELAEELPESPVEWLGASSFPQDEANLQDADKVVSGGRGLRKGENFALVRELAQALDAAVGASRDTVDRGWVSYPHQVGLSGKTVSPRLYVAAGISGSIQHLAGMRTSGCIVAINNDPDAQIFQVADFGVVGDLFEFVPVLAEEVRRRKSQKERSA